uniref:Uncharacterized protein n=1 Tax=Rhizophora mucronata TaxID=61149 RepID=A0A2P2QIG1_RHIMU
MCLLTKGHYHVYKYHRLITYSKYQNFSFFSWFLYL